MIVLIGGTKGGSGKSTIAMNIAAYLACEGQDFILVDTDTQPSSSKWVDRRNKNSDLAKIHCVQRTGDVQEAILDLEKRYGTVVIDAGGKESEELSTAMCVADKFYVPLRASQLDLETLGRLGKYIALVKPINKKLKIFALLSQAPSSPFGNEIAEARELLEDFPGITLSEQIIRERKIYRDAIPEGKGVVEMKNSTAKAEIQLLAQEIFNHGN